MKDNWPCSEMEWHCTRIEDAITATDEEAAKDKRKINNKNIFIKLIVMFSKNPGQIMS